MQTEADSVTTNSSSYGESDDAVSILLPASERHIEDFGGFEHNIDLELHLSDDDPSLHTSDSLRSSGSRAPLLRESRFASRERPCPWFPGADPNHKGAQTFKAWLSRRKTTLALACTISLVVFLTNLVATIYLPLHHNDGRLFTGNCTIASRLSASLHIAINLLSSLLLGASNLCMQLLSVPTRAEIDKAHARKKWLDIGIPSLRNLNHIAKKRQIIWILLALGSFPLHFLYATQHGCPMSFSS